MFTALENGDFPGGRLMFQPDAPVVAGPLRDSAFRCGVRPALRSARTKMSNDTWKLNALPARPDRRRFHAGYMQ